MLASYRQGREPRRADRTDCRCGRAEGWSSTHDSRPGPFIRGLDRAPRQRETKTRATQSRNMAGRTTTAGARCCASLKRASTSVRLLRPRPAHTAGRRRAGAVVRAQLWRGEADRETAVAGAEERARRRRDPRCDAGVLAGTRCRPRFVCSSSLYQTASTAPRSPPTRRRRRRGQRQAGGSRTARARTPPSIYPRQRAGPAVRCRHARHDARRRRSRPPR